MAGHNALAQATSNPCEHLDAISKCLLQNLQSCPFLGMPDAFHDVDLVCVAIATFKRSSTGVKGLSKSCILNK